MLEQGRQVINYLQQHGVDYADIRIHQLDEEETIATMKGDVDKYNLVSKQGYGIRVLVNGAWGFASSEVMTLTAMQQTGHQAIAKAKTASDYIQQKVRLAPKAVIQDSYTSPCQIDPFTVSTQDKLARLLQLDSQLADKRFDYWGVSASFYKRDILYIDSEGSEIRRHLIELDAELFAYAKDQNGEQCRRTFNLPQDANGTTGWENIINDAQFDHTARIREELLALLDAPECEKEVCDVILLPEMMALQTHETIGHALELDRILGYELSYAGGSHVDLADFGQLQFGSHKLTARADGTVANSPGSIGYDDDGVKARNVTLIKNGILQDAITSRQMIMEANAKAGRTIFSASGATSRAQNYSNLPIERMNNINIDPGQDGSLADIIAATENGLLMETPRSWSIGSNRENFHFATEVAWKIKHGKITHMVRNATYRGDSLSFWNALDMVGDERTWQLQPVFQCGKGQPNQIMRLAHGIPACRFKNVQVGE
ncbi:TldD/PmbA family protein [Motilimonas sp. 1_MG-2023]|uniref:TldD/PmbA family protein n=1 Tax=Motilimonas sp. 1_MG-2023 TaxID=3062672 RepID=UPI0026E22C8E|nr:TldD/PmbA family protein [Motilimonas sp. 1_MG-2023]MDO6527691.1 TldD/PmbA family protein [Motilimonas sp. 1_MG-2023]